MGYTTKKFNFQQDSEDLLCLWNEVLKYPSPQRMANMFTENSYGIPAAWLIFHDASENPVGSVAVFPRSIVSNAQENLLGINCDMLILKKHRTLGPALMVLKALIKGCRELGYHALFAMPNKKSQPVFKRVGYKKIGTAYRWSKVLKSEDKILPIIKWMLPRKAVALFMDLVLKFASINPWIKFRYFKLWWNFVERDVTLEQVLVPKNPVAENILKKSPDYLKWRYAAVLCQGNPEIFALYCKEQLLGYVIYTLDDKEVIVQEFFLQGADSGIHVLLSKFIKKMYRQKHSSISILHYGPEHFEKMLKQHGFIKREGRDVFINILEPKKNDLAVSLKNFSWFEGDLDL